MRTKLTFFLAGVVLIPAVVFVAGWFGFLPTTVKQKAPTWERAFARHALYAAAARRAPHLQDPIAPTEANLARGLKLFLGDCAGCHGRPSSPPSTNEALYPNPTRFLHAPSAPDWQLYWIIENGVRYTGMFTWGGQFVDSTGRDVSPERIWLAVTFLRHLDSLPPSVAAEWNKPRQ
ncbi:MAG TPA: c-type cytochrome [Gemmatimonadaceae bacterium]|nr:c-type cytochrome [Gemmatimonadaceae bacterium]